MLDDYNTIDEPWKMHWKLFISIHISLITIGITEYFFQYRLVCNILGEILSEAVFDQTAFNNPNRVDAAESLMIDNKLNT